MRHKLDVSIKRLRIPPPVKASTSYSRGQDGRVQGQGKETYYSSWKDPSINKDFTPGHFFKKRSLICTDQEKHYHSDKRYND